MDFVKSPQVYTYPVHARAARDLFEYPGAMVATMKGMPLGVNGATNGGTEFNVPSSNTIRSFRGGEQCVLVGLRGSAHLNGRCGFVGAFDQPSGRFDVWLAPMSLSSKNGLKMNWIDSLQDQQQEQVIRAKPCNIQAINVSNSRSQEVDFEALLPQQKVTVLRAQKALWDESTMFKDGVKRPPNFIALFRGEHKPCPVQLVSEPQPGIVPDDVGKAIVVRRELDAESEGVAGFIYVLASNPRVLMSFRVSSGSDHALLDGKRAADYYMKFIKG